MPSWFLRPEDDPDHEERVRRELDEQQAGEEREQVPCDRLADYAPLPPWERDAHRQARRTRERRPGTEGKEQW
ncbi:MAG: hypothetical protein ABI950_03240 [Solirubrobacteraceae bacterium]